MKSRKRKALLVASHGGHWVQLLRLAPALDGCERHYICTTAAAGAEVAPEPLTAVRDANLKDLFGLLPLALKVLYVVVRLRPDIVVSTGAAPGFFALMFGKMLGARTIWVDSLANAERLSVSGTKARLFADLWLTQWPEVSRPSGPFYRGSLL